MEMIGELFVASFGFVTTTSTEIPRRRRLRRGAKGRAPPSSSDLREPAVDRDLGAGDVRSFGRAQEQHRAGDVCRLPPPAERDHRLDVRAHVLGAVRGGGQRRLDRPRAAPSRPTSTTSAPSATKRRAVSRPIPLLPPVIKTTFPSNLGPLMSRS